MARPRPRLAGLPLALALAFLVAVVRPAPASAAAPWVIVVSGPTLGHPITLTTWMENSWLLSGDPLPDVAPGSLVARPFYDLALFWGPAWKDYAATHPTPSLKPEQANQHARFYLATDASPPYVVVDQIPGPDWPVLSLPAQGAAVLACHGIPSRVQTSATPGHRLREAMPSPPSSPDCRRLATPPA